MDIRSPVCPVSPATRQISGLFLAKEKPLIRGSKKPLDKKGFAKGFLTGELSFSDGY